MRRNIILLSGLAILATSGLTSTNALAGDILRTTPASDFKWRSTDCRKPIQNTSPSLSKQASLERYSKDITAYLACLQREAQLDFEKAQMQMQIAVEKELEAETKRMDEMILRAYRAR